MHLEPAKFAPPSAGAQPQETAAPALPGAQTSLEISSSPAGADIELDGAFVGNTPTTIGVASGEHTLRLSKNGYAAWERTLKTSTGIVKIAPELEPAAPAPDQ
jgi:hypothetical protein